MAAPIYFFPKLTRQAFAAGDKPNPRILLERGLLDVLGDVPSLEHDTVCTEIVGSGPGGASGVLLSVKPPRGRDIGPRNHGYFAQFQDWHHVVDAGDLQLWIGLDKEHPVTPADIQRPKPCDGRALDLADGAVWTIATVRRPNDTSELPQDLGWDDRGNYRETVKPQYRALWDDTAEVIEWFLDKQLLIENMPRALDLCVRGLGVNYRYGRHEQNVLKLIDSVNYATLMAWMVDLPLRAAWFEAEKKRAATPSSAPTGESTNTPPGSGG